MDILYRRRLTLAKFIVIATIAAILVLLLFATSIWKMWRDHKYEIYTEGMKYAFSSSGIVPRYVSEVNGDTYYVKYPDYLSTTGNLAVKPSDSSVLDSLIVWPQMNGECKFGVILNEGGTLYQVYIDEAGETALYADYQWLVDKHKAIIQQYLAKAKRMWNIDG